MTMHQYDVEEWAAGTTLGRRIFNHNYRMLGGELKGWKLVKVVTMREGDGVTERAYIWEGTGDRSRDLIRIDIAELDSWRSSQEHLQEQLAHSSRSQIPRGRGMLAEVGDVNFVGRAPESDIPARVCFSRGNMFISISSVGDAEVDVSEITASLDRALSEPPAKAEAKKRHLRVAPPKEVVAEPDEDYPLIRSLRKAAPGGGWLKVTAPDGELMRKGDSLIYVSPEGGKKQISIVCESE